MSSKNLRIDDLQRTIQTYHKYFYDNADMLSFMTDIKNDTNGNDFEIKMKKILSMKEISINEFVNFLYKFNAIYQYTDYVRSVIDGDDDKYTEYKRLSDKNFSIVTTIPSPPDANTIYIGVTNQTLDERDWYSIQIPIIFTCFDNEIGSVTNNINDQSNPNKKYLYYLTHLGEFNIKSQIHALHSFLEIVKHFIKFYVYSKRVYNIPRDYAGDPNKFCNYFNNEMITNIINTTLELNNIDNNKILIDARSYDIDTSDPCAIMLKETIPRTNRIIQSNLEGFNYTCKIGNIYYDVISINENKDASNQFILTISLKAYSSGCTSNQQLPSDYQSLSTSSAVQATILNKNIANLRKEYINSGKELKLLNQSIEKSKGKINNISQKSKIQSDVNQSLKTRLTIYYIIIALIILSYIFVYFLGKEDIKMYIAVGTFIVAILMNIINFFINTSLSVENYVNNVPICSDINQNSSLSKKKTFMENNSLVFMNYIFELFAAYDRYLSTIDTKDIFNKITNNLHSEKKEFKEHDSVFKSKIELNKATVDVMMHDNKSNISYIYMISGIILLATMFYLLYNIEPKYLNSYLIATTVLLTYILVVYYYTTTQLVNTKSTNYYWKNISNSVMDSL